MKRIRTRSRQVTYLAVATALLALSFSLQSVPWQGSAQLHTLLEVVAALLALIVGLVALLHYCANRSSTFLFLGAGFLGAAFLDAYHALVTSQPLASWFPLMAENLGPWSWTASRFFLAHLLVFSWIAWRRQSARGPLRTMPEPLLLAVALVLAAGVFFCMPLADWSASGGIPAGSGALQYLPAALLLIALAGYLGKRRWMEDPFEHAVVVSLIVGLASQALAMSRTLELYDGMFDLAHALKIGSYAIVLAGLHYEIYDSFEAARNRAAQAEQLEEAIEMLEQRTQQLLHARRALVNMMEDSERAREATEATRRELAAQAAELARSNGELEQFAYVVSHDLKEPLRMVSGYVQLLADDYQGQLDGDADEFIGFAIDGAERMQAMIDDILRYSRVSTSGIDMVEVQLSQVIDVVRHNLAFQVQKTGARIEVEPLPAVLASATLMEQLFQNLIANAVKFHGQELPHVMVGCQRRGDHWILSVRDNGIGVDPQHFDRIFGIFQRLHTRTEYEGTGIGLAICKKIVECHGGRIWVESEPGQGTTFFFSLPVARGKTVLRAPEAAGLTASAPQRDESAVALPG